MFEHFIHWDGFSRQSENPLHYPENVYPSWLPWGQQNDTHEPLQNQGTHTWIVAVPARLVPRFQTLWRRCRHHGKYPSSEKHLVIFFRRSVVFFRKRFLGRSFWWKSEKKTKNTSTYVKSLSTRHQHVTKIHVDLLTPTFWLDPMFDSSLTRVYR